MTKYQKRRKHHGRKLTVIGIAILSVALLCVMGIFIYEFYLKSQIPEVLRNSDSNEKYSSVLESNDNYIIAAHFPSLDNETIGSSISDTISGYITDFKTTYQDYTADTKADRMILSVDFDIYRVDGQYESIVINKAISNDVDKLNYQTVMTLTYDVNSGIITDLSDLFKDGYLKRIAALLRHELKSNDSYEHVISNVSFYRNTLADEANFKLFALDNDQLVIFYDSAKVIENSDSTIAIKLDLNSLAYYLFNPIKADTSVIEPSTTDNTYLRYIDPDKPMVALTFDDGPYTLTTGKIIDVLARYHSAATFFMVGNRIATYSDTVIEVLKRGNEIGNHSYTHKYNLSKLSFEDLKTELDNVQTTLNKYVTDYKITLLRPTYGAISESLKENCDYILINWSVDPKDWKWRNSEIIYDNVINKVHNGDIVLMHDIYMSTAEAVENIVPKLIDMGYQLVTVSELLEYNDIKPLNGQLYYSVSKN